MATSYRKKYCDAVIGHFSAMRKNEKGEIVGVPSFVSFAESIGVPLSVLEKWRRENAEFDKACEDATELMRQLLIDASLNGSVNVSAAKFILSSVFGMAPASKSASGKRQKGALAEEEGGLSDFDRALLQNLMERLDGEDEPL